MTTFLPQRNRTWIFCGVMAWNFAKGKMVKPEWSESMCIGCPAWYPLSTHSKFFHLLIVIDILQTDNISLGCCRNWLLTWDWGQKRCLWPSASIASNSLSHATFAGAQSLLNDISSMATCCWGISLEGTNHLIILTNSLTVSGCHIRLKLRALTKSLGFIMGLRTRVGKRVQVGWVQVWVTPKSPTENPHPRGGFGGFLYLNKLNIKYTTVRPKGWEKTTLNNGFLQWFVVGFSTVPVAIHCKYWQKML